MALNLFFPHENVSHHNISPYVFVFVPFSISVNIAAVTGFLFTMTTENAKNAPLNKMKEARKNVKFRWLYMN